MEKLAAGAIFQPWRSTANGQKINRWSFGRPPGRSLGRPSKPYGRPPSPESGVLAVGRPLVDRPKWLASMHVLCTSVERSGRSTLGPVDRQSLAGCYKGQKNLVFNCHKNFIKTLKIHKNSFIIIHRYTNMCENFNIYFKLFEPFF